MKITYNQILTTFEGFATAHKQINEFGSGDLWEVIQHNKLSDFTYPLLFVTDKPASLSDGSITMSYDILVMDRAEEGAMENEVKSDTLLILLDCIAYFEKLYADNWNFVSIGKTSTATPFTERFDDTLTGWSMGITLKMPLQYDECQIPYVGYTPSPTPGCDDATVKDADGNILGTVISGGIFSVASSVVSNSDASYSVSVLAEATLALPDITHTDSDGSPSILPAQTPMVCTPSVAQGGIAYYKPTPPKSDIISYANNDAEWNVANGVYDYTPPAYPLHYAKLDYTQTHPFLWLENNNVFGNKSRYTLNDGTALTTAGDDTVRPYVIDHYTGYGITSVIDGTLVDWATQLTNATALSITVDSDTYNDFFLGSMDDHWTILFNYSRRRVYQSIPWELFTTLNTSVDVFSSETSYTAASAQYIADGTPRNAIILKTIPRLQVYYRQHYI